jgi:lactoylglutathione lyase
MQLQLTTIHVDDLEESKRFYQNILELEEVKRLSPRPGVEISFLSDQAGGTIELIAEDTEVSESSSRVSIGFEIDNMAELVENLEEQGIELLRGPIETGSGTKLAFIEDPNGVEVEFIAGLTL